MQIHLHHVKTIAISIALAVALLLGGAVAAGSGPATMSNADGPGDPEGAWYR